MPIDIEKKRLAQRRYYLRNHERILARKRQYRKDNAEKVLQKEKEYREQNRERILKTSRRFRRGNPERCREYSKKYRDSNPEKHRELARQAYLRRKGRKQEYQREYRKVNQEELRAKRRIHYSKTKEKQRAQKAAYRAANRDRIRELDRHRRRRNTVQVSSHEKIRSRLSRRIHRAVKAQFTEKAEKTIDLIGCSMQRLFAHLESQFRDGMSWNNYGLYGWHIDHKIPCASFDLTDRHQQRICFHYTNLQPLWAKENLSKGCSTPPPAPVDSAKKDKPRG